MMQLRRLLMNEYNSVFYAVKDPYIDNTLENLPNAYSLLISTIMVTSALKPQITKHA